MKFIARKSNIFYIFLTSFLASIMFALCMNINDLSNITKIIVTGIEFFIIMFILLLIFIKFLK
ncbi:hypothetical protein [Clostridium thermobutyricum]|uniref:Uncharacterized protein n=1 Tax=Clostridium thermobutyricum DSM 4928 TaxID=1121339 RepID=A0A1V4SZ56_9CLOT|nr:hypothetical protein [Clostridium thermobutyricum]OPX50909.1 hypothetical protein CLTHE_02100 [Clostridium thermobutyricum DSM 4928]